MPMFAAMDGIFAIQARVAEIQARANQALGNAAPAPAGGRLGAGATAAASGIGTGTFEDALAEALNGGLSGTLGGLDSLTGLGGLSSLTGIGGLTGGERGRGTASRGAPVAASGSVREFLDILMQQAGKKYVFGAEASVSNPDPKAFDCSEIIEWALGRMGIEFPDGSANQFENAREAGLEIPIDEAIRTPGAILFRRGSPNHIAVSLGDGRTIEARGSKYGVGVFEADGRNWSGAARLPGLSY